MVMKPPARQERRVRSLGREDPLAKRMAIHSSMMAWKIPWTEEPGRLQSLGRRRVKHGLEPEPPPPRSESPSPFPKLGPPGCSDAVAATTRTCNGIWGKSDNPKQTNKMYSGAETQ